MSRLGKIVLLLSTPFIVHGCGDNSVSGAGETVSVVLANESNFTLEALFLHEQPLNYKEKPNLLTEPLQPGTSLADAIPARQWYVTVYRQPNKDSAVLAYTTATAWNAAVYKKIIYFDEQFRVSLSP